MSTNCTKHCWHNMPNGPTCCWCGTILIPYADPSKSHGPHLANPPVLLARGMKPTTNGWYLVTWEQGEAPARVYVRVSDIGLTWGWDEEDDPEWIREPEHVVFEPVQSTEERHDH